MGSASLGTDCDLTDGISGAYRLLRTEEPPKKRKRGTRRWPKRCTRREWRD